MNVKRQIHLAADKLKLELRTLAQNQRSVCSSSFSLVLLSCALLLAGCVVQSLHPFCTEKSVLATAPVLGEWQSSDPKVKPWTFDDHGTPGQIALVWFKLGTNIFCDSVAGDPPDDARINGYWLVHARAVHTVCKVEVKGDTATFFPLNYEWFSKAAERKEVEIPALKQKDTLPLYTATPLEWEQFLTKHASNTNAFSDKVAIVLKRVPATPPAK
jgi:hypothetical protein